MLIDELEGQALLFRDAALALALLYVRAAVMPVERFDAWRAVTHALASLVRAFAAESLDAAERTHVSEAPALARLAACAAEQVVAAHAELVAGGAA